MPWSWAVSPVEATMILCRNPTKNSRRVSSMPDARSDRSTRQVDVLVIVAPGQGAQTPGFLQPWLEDAAFAVPAGLAGHRRRARPGPLRHRGGCRHHPRHPDRPAAARRHRAGHRARVPDPRASPRSAPSPGTASASSPPLPAPPARSAASRRWCWSASAARRWPTASAATPTGMTAVLGGDRDEVLAALEQHGLTPPTTTAPARSSPPARWSSSRPSPRTRRPRPG